MKYSATKALKTRWISTRTATGDITAVISCTYRRSAAISTVTQRPIIQLSAVLHAAEIDRSFRQRPVCPQWERYTVKQSRSGKDIAEAALGRKGYGERKKVLVVVHLSVLDDESDMMCERLVWREVWSGIISWAIPWVVVMSFQTQWKRNVQLQISQELLKRNERLLQFAASTHYYS